MVYPKVTWDGDVPRMETDGPYSGLRTANALSSTKVVTANQVVGSIVMFGVIYLLLFAVWVYVLDGKIRHGPEDVTPAPEATSPADLLEAAARLPRHEGYSLTAAQQPDVKEEKRE